MAITNEDFQDRANRLMKDLAKQTGTKIVGGAMFFLSENKQGRRCWTTVHNYNGILTSSDFLQLTLTVGEHVKDVCSDSDAKKVNGEEEEEERFENNY